MSRGAGANMVPAGVTAYLRRVTCLLPRRAAQEVRAELLGHLYQSQLDAQVRGLPETAAWAEALRGAGPAFPAALRFARVYTLGLLRWLLVGAVLGGAAYAVQGGSHPAQAIQQADGQQVLR